MIFLNYKTYEKGTGELALEISRIAEEVSKQSGVKIIPVVQASDIAEIVQSVSLEIWAQKVDSVEFGAHTGSVVPEAVFEDGAMGTFLNHSENKSDFETLAKAHDRAVEIGLKTLVFAADTEELKKICSLNPNFVSYEPPSLIGSSDVSVTSAEPEIVKQAVEISRNAGIPLVVGAGVHSMEDVKKSLELGAIGVAVASDVMKAEDPKKELLDLTSGFQ